MCFGVLAGPSLIPYQTQNHSVTQAPRNDFPNWAPPPAITLSKWKSRPRTVQPSPSKRDVLTLTDQTSPAAVKGLSSGQKLWLANEAAIWTRALLDGLLLDLPFSSSSFQPESITVGVVQPIVSRFDSSLISLTFLKHFCALLILSQYLRRTRRKWAGSSSSSSSSFDSRFRGVALEVVYLAQSYLRIPSYLSPWFVGTISGTCDYESEHFDLQRGSSTSALSDKVIACKYEYASRHQQHIDRDAMRIDLRSESGKVFSFRNLPSNL